MYHLKQRIQHELGMYEQTAYFGDRGPEMMILYADDQKTVLEDSATLADYRIPDRATILLVWKVAMGNNDYDSVGVGKSIKWVEDPPPTPEPMKKWRKTSVPLGGRWVHP